MFVCGECGQRYDRGGYCADGRPLIATDDPLLGTEVGRYRLARLLGEGGMGQVYLGVQPVIGSRVAIKVLSDHCAKKPDLLDRFFAEAKAVNLIRHESIVSVLDMAKLPDGRPYIVMEFVEGHTLGKLVPTGPLPLGGIVQLFGEVLSALAAAHAIGIVHRDLKPDNILVTAEGHAKVLDFGIAKLAPGLSHLSPRTRTGALLGTPAYMAPEQISGSGAIDPRTDIYSAGVVLYEVVTGRAPFEGETLFDLMRQHLEVAPVPPTRVRPDLPPALEAVILTALAKPPEARYQSATAMARALDHAAQQLPAEQWRALSRGHVITGGVQSVSRSGSRTVRPGAVATRAHTTQSSPRGGRLVAGMIASALVASAITIAIVWHARSSDDGAPITEPAITAAPGPLIAGSGSAADHGVHLGKHVTVGPGVIVGSDRARQPPPKPTTTTVGKPPATNLSATAVAKSTATNAPAPRNTITKTVSPSGDVTQIVISSTPKRAIEKPADYNPRAFDPLAYLPKARAMARQLLGDAEFTELQLYENVLSDGRVDLTLPSDSESYFEFRSQAFSKPPPGTTAKELGCYVMVYVTARTVEARVREDDDCNHPLRRPPRCRMADVWKAAIALGEKPDAPASIAFLHDGKWFFDRDHAARRGDTTVHTIDDCK